MPTGLAAQAGSLQVKVGDQIEELPQRQPVLIGAKGPNLFSV